VITQHAEVNFISRFPYVCVVHRHLMSQVSSYALHDSGALRPEKVESFVV